jgi:hypothetical protein
MRLECLKAKSFWCRGMLHAGSGSTPKCSELTVPCRGRSRGALGRSSRLDLEGTESFPGCRRGWSHGASQSSRGHSSPATLQSTPSALPCCPSGHAGHGLGRNLRLVRLPSYMRNADPSPQAERPECWIPPPPELKDGLLRHTPCFHGIDHVIWEVFFLCQVT